MAIVKMKKLCVVAMESECRELMRQLQKLGCVQIRRPDEQWTDPRWKRLLKREDSEGFRADLAEANVALSALQKYAGRKDGLLSPRREVSQDEFSDGKTVKEGRAATFQIDLLVQRKLRLEAEEAQLKSKCAALEPWRDLDLPLERQGSEHVLYRMGVVPAAADYGMLRTELSALEIAAELLEISADDQQRYLLLLCCREDESAAMNLLREHGFSAAGFSEYTGTAAENLQRMESEIRNCQEEKAKNEQELVQCGKSWDALKLYSDRMSSEANLLDNTDKLLTDGTVVSFTGWVPAEREQELNVLLERYTCAWETADPTEEELREVPVQLKNNWFTKPLNMVTEMYSLPAYSNVDPNPLMAPFFILFYGIMMADMGYGLLMFLAGTIVSRKYHPRGTLGHMCGLLTLCGISTFVMGAITGGFFGDFLTQVVLLTTGKNFVLPALFTPLNDTLMILIGAMALGFVQIVTGMAVSFVHKLRNGQVMDAVWEELTWWIVFAGAGLAVLGMTKLVLYLGLAMVLLGPILTNKGIGKLTGIFSSLYNHITGYFGDILSYSRLMALMLAGSVIAQVFNTLGAIPGNIVLFLIISLVGNALNFGLNLLGCYVHDLRLQCLEYFGKFYEDGGKPFQPLTFQTKYVEVNQD